MAKATSQIVAPEGNFRVNEPSAAADLESLATVKILWIDPCPGEASVDETNGRRGIGLRTRLLHELRSQRYIPMKELQDAFPAASEYYREHGLLRLHLEEAPTDPSQVQLSRWENVFAAKKFAVVLTMLVAPLADAESQEFGKRLSEIKTLLQQTKFASSLRRCIVFDPPTRFASSLETDLFLVVKSSVPVTETARSLVRDISADVVHHIASRTLALSLSSGEAASFRTPMDKIDFGETAASTDPKSELGKVLRCRAAKRRGDLLLQLSAPDAAMMAYGELTISSSDSLWVAAHLECIGVARFLEGKATMQLEGDLRTISAAPASAFQRGPAADVASTAVESLNRIEATIRDCVTAQRKSLLSLGSSLPQLTRQRVVKEIEEPMGAKLENVASAIGVLRSSNNNAVETAAVNAACSQLRDASESIITLWFSEVELYLVEAFHQYRILQPRLFELEAELYLKLSWLRAEQRNVKRVLEAVADLIKTLKFVSPEAALRVARVIPDVCLRCGCKRKAVYYAIDSMHKDKKAGNVKAALASALRVADWCAVPLFVDDATGTLVWKDASQLSSSTLSSPSAVGGTASAPFGSGLGAEPLSAVTDFHNRAVSKVLHSSRSHLQILFEMIDILRHNPTAEFRFPGLRSQIASAALFLYSDYMDAYLQTSVMSMIQLDSLNLPPYIPASVVPPPVLLSLQPLPLSAHLRPQTVSMGGAVFTYIDTTRQRLTVLSLDGAKLQHDVVWVAGETAAVEVQLANPFDVLLQVTSVSLVVEFVPRDIATSGSSPSGEHQGECVTPYVLDGLVLHPRSTTKLKLYVLPLKAGTSRLLGVELLLGQLAKSVSVPMVPVISVPVVRELPKVECLFASHEVELFAGQTVSIRLQITNVGKCDVQQLSISAHSSTCQLVNCDGCRERHTAANRDLLTVALSRLDLRDALPLAPREFVSLTALLVAPPTFTAATFDHLVFRVDYHHDYPPPIAPAGVAPAVPVFAVVPRRIMESRLRIHSIPSLRVTNMSLSRDRRYVEVRVKNDSPRHTIELQIGTRQNGEVVPLEPFHGIGSPAVVFLAGAEIILPLIEISKLPERSACQFYLPWTVRNPSRLVATSSVSGSAISSPPPACEGTLGLDLTQVVEGITLLEALEEMVVLATFETAPSHLRPTAPAAGVGTESSAVDSDGNHANVAYAPPLQNWISAAPSRLPVSLPAVRPVALTVAITAPWKSTIRVRVDVLLDMGAEVGMVSGSTRKRVEIGSEGALGYDGRFELCIFKSGEHFLVVQVTDDSARCITHHIRLQVEHAVLER